MTTCTWSRALRRAGAAALVVVAAGCDGDTKRIVTEGSRAGESLPAASSPSPSPSPSPAPSPVPSPLPAAPPPAAPTPKPPPSPSPSPSPAASPARPGFRVELRPTQIPGSVEGWATGTGCAGAGYGVTVEVQDAQGTLISGDGGASMPDGSWRIPFSFGGGPGSYTVVAKCRANAPGGVILEYAPQPLTVP